MSRARFTPARVLTAIAAAGATVGLAYLARTWYRYGRVHRRPADPLLDRYMPAFVVAERHDVRVAAPADVTYAAALALDLRRSGLVQAIFRARERMLGAHDAAPERPRAFLEELRDIGWGVLEEEPGRVLVMGAITQPWLADVTFRSLPPAAFAAFSEPGCVKIVWTFVVEPRGPSASILRTETRVATTDTGAHRRFRRYWMVFSAGIILIRHRALSLIKADAERTHSARVQPLSSSAP